MSPTAPQQNDEPQRQPPRGRDACHEPRIVGSDDILQGEKVVVISHDGEQYRLLVTRNNKLILQK